MTHSGVGGERVVPTMRLRLEEELRQAEAMGFRCEHIHNDGASQRQFQLQKSNIQFILINVPEYHNG